MYKKIPRNSEGLFLILTGGNYNETNETNETDGMNENNEMNDM